jgi:Bifunctional DNA primase/polymerase, N-terminal
MSGKFTVQCSDRRSLCRGTSRGFAIVRIEELRLAVRELAVHEKNGKAWAQLPSQPWIKNGALVAGGDGKTKYSPLFEFDSDKVRTAFSDAVIRAVLAFDTRALEAMASLDSPSLDGRSSERPMEAAPRLLSATPPSAWAPRALRVFPCWPRRKEPAIRDNFRLAAVDETIIRRLWGEQGIYNVAIATGRASGLWVLDIDVDHGGKATLRELEARHGALPATVEVITGAARHLYWRWPDGADIRNTQHRDDLPGVDWRGEGGYVLAPPSIHPSGRAYAWSVDSASEFAPAPQWLIDVVTARGRRPGNGAMVAPTLPASWQAIMEGEHEGSRRAGTVAKLFGHLVRQTPRTGIDPVAALSLAQIFDRARNSPPLGHDEVVRICRDIAEREAERRDGE